MNKKLSMKLSNQECEDLWSALVVWDRHLNHEVNPSTSKAIQRLIKRVRSHIGKLK